MMQVFTGVSRSTPYKVNSRLSLTECVWDCRNNALWDTHEHSLLQCIDTYIYDSKRSRIPLASTLMKMDQIDSCCCLLIDQGKTNRASIQTIDFCPVNHVRPRGLCDKNCYSLYHHYLYTLYTYYTCLYFIVLYYKLLTSMCSRIDLASHRLRNTGIYKNLSFTGEKSCKQRKKKL